MTATARAITAGFLIAAGLFVGPAVGQTCAPSGPIGCTGDGNCSGDPRAEAGR